MSISVKIKIRRVDDVETAKKLEQLGVDFIGVHVIWRLTRDKETLHINLAKELSKTGLVIVTRAKDLNILDLITRKLRPQYLQLHAKWNRYEIRQLRELITDMGHVFPKIIGVVALETLASVNLIDELVDCDYLLFDRSFKGGTGLAIEEKVLRKAAEKATLHRIRFFIAGGLRPDNVGYYIRVYRPYGVDVQTGVEVFGAPGRKDFNKVRQFIEECR